MATSRQWEESLMTMGQAEAMVPYRRADMFLDLQKAHFHVVPVAGFDRFTIQAALHEGASFDDGDITVEASIDGEAWYEFGDSGTGFTDEGVEKVVGDTPAFLRFIVSGLSSSPAVVRVSMLATLAPKSDGVIF